MIAHVAEAGEARGRVIVRTVSARASDIAMQAAVRIAQAYRSEIESLYIEDTELIASSRFPFVREISLLGAIARPITPADVVRDLRFQFKALQRRLGALAGAAQVPIHERFVRDEPLRALAITCADCGPWNVVVLTEPFGAGSGGDIALLLDNVEDATGIVIVGPRASRTSGPVAMFLEDIDALSGMMRAGDRLVDGTDIPLVLAIVAGDGETAGWLESQARLMLGERPDVHFVHLALAHAEPALAAEAIRRMRPGFVIARFGGLVVPVSEDLSPLAAALECPLLLSR
jgi:hypothetical protein